MSGTLRPGTFVRLDETAAQLGVSITPVREALLKLSGEGMVQLEPHRGHVVVPLSRKDIEDIFWLQATIARELVRTTAANITDAEIDELADLNDALAKAVAERNPDAVVGAEFAFHRALNRPADRVKLAWFLLHAARYMPPLVYATDPGWGDRRRREPPQADRRVARPRRRRGGGADRVAVHRRRPAAHREAREVRDVGLTAYPARLSARVLRLPAR